MEFHGNGRLCARTDRPTRAFIEHRERVELVKSVRRVTAISDIVGNTLTDEQYIDVRLATDLLDSRPHGRLLPNKLGQRGMADNDDVGRRESQFPQFSSLELIN